MLALFFVLQQSLPKRTITPPHHPELFGTRLRKRVRLKCLKAYRMIEPALAVRVALLALAFCAPLELRVLSNGLEGLKFFNEYYSAIFASITLPQPLKKSSFIFPCHRKSPHRLMNCPYYSYTHNHGNPLSKPTLSSISPRPPFMLCLLFSPLSPTLSFAVFVLSTT